MVESANNKTALIMKIGTALDPHEPFGHYTLAMLKADTEKNLKPRKEHNDRVARWRENGFTITSIFMAASIVGLLSLQGMTS